MEPDDELARTATADGGSAPSCPASLDEGPGAAIGRYRLERQLGIGGMGVVHVAFDPDLERRVALKVLRAAGDHAAKRLQREARAMARLTHPNVVTVHEVGTAAGRDYVAMELIEGTNLAEWLRAGTRDPAQILEAFVAAGRGLAAAHDAGIVHRDFKPHNVLRSRGGRIAVTDFGLAREAVIEGASDPLAQTQPVPTGVGTTSSSSTPATSLAGLTVTGAVLGTPAYMAPEQWEGKSITPATDQFAFCVALWEALAGSRPYPGPSAEELRAQVTAGPAALDASKLPRRLRDILLRGLASDPADRWPTMHELLSRLGDVGRRRGLVLGAAGAGLAATGVLVFALAGGGGEPPRCAAPVVDPGAVWPGTARDALVRVGQAEAVRALDADLARWSDERAAACAMPAIERAPRLACLDGVLARFDTVVRSAGALGKSDHIDVGARLIDPEICRVAPPPRLVGTSTPLLVDAMTEVFRAKQRETPLEAATATELRARLAPDPCATAAAYPLISTVEAPAQERDRAFSEAERAAELCGDDRLRAEVMLAAASRAIGDSFLAETAIEKIRRAESAVQRVAQRDLVAHVEMLRAAVAARTNEVDDAIVRARAAGDGFEARARVAEQLQIELVLVELQQLRGRADEISAIPDQLARVRQLAVDRLGLDTRLVRKIEIALAQAALARGDVAKAHAELARLRRSRRQTRSRKVTGSVLDATGAPVAGARVVVARVLTGTTISAATTGDDPSWREAVTGADGGFEIADAPDDGVAVAELGDRRTRPASIADRVELRLTATSRVEGRVDLAGSPAPSVGVLLEEADSPPGQRYVLMAPVATDGRFSIDGVWRGRVRIYAAASAGRGAVASSTIDVGQPVVHDVTLAVATTKREIHVIVRSTVGMPVPNAQVLTLPGTIASTNGRDLVRDVPSSRSRLARPIEGEQAPGPVLAVAAAGDLFVTIGVPEGAASACAIGLPTDLGAPNLQQTINNNLEKIEIRCVPVPPAAEAVIVEVPPWPRL